MKSHYCLLALLACAGLNAKTVVIMSETPTVKTIVQPGTVALDDWCQALDGLTDRLTAGTLFASTQKPVTVLVKPVQNATALGVDIDVLQAREVSRLKTAAGFKAFPYENYVNYVSPSTAGLYVVGVSLKNGTVAADSGARAAYVMTLSVSKDGATVWEDSATLVPEDNVYVQKTATSDVVYVQTGNTVVVEKPNTTEAVYWDIVRPVTRLIFAPRPHYPGPAPMPAPAPRPAPAPAPGPGPRHP